MLSAGSAAHLHGSALGGANHGWFMAKGLALPPLPHKGLLAAHTSPGEHNGTLHALAQQQVAQPAHAVHVVAVHLRRRQEGL